MTTISFITRLKSILPESDWPWIFAALHYDQLIWGSFSGDFVEKILNLNSNRPEDYTPAALALIALDLPLSTDHLRSVPMHSTVDEQVDEWAVNQADIPLAEAGLQALDLREQRRVDGNWEGVLSKLTTISPSSLACLYGMIPDPIGLLKALVTSNNNDATTKFGSDLALHALLSNPLQPSLQFQILNELFAELSSNNQLYMSRSLSYARPDLAAKMSIIMHNDLEKLRESQPTSIDDATEILLELIHTAELSLLPGNSSDATPILQESITAARRLQAQLAAKLATTIAGSDNTTLPLTTWEQATTLDPAALDLQAGYALALLDAGRTADAQAHLGPSPYNHPSLWLANAILNIQRGEFDVAIESACQALALIEEKPTDNEYHPVEHTINLARILLELNLPRESTRAAEIAVCQKPNDPDILSLLTCTLSASVMPEEAVESAHIAVALSPERTDLRILLAESQEIMGDYLSALKQRSLLMAGVEEPPSEDLASLAYCAHKAGQPENATQLCQHLIQLDENDGEAYVILGEASASLGDSKSALENLHKATMLTPEHSEPWLALARQYERDGQSGKSLETLQAAAHAAPELPEIHLALGEAYLDQNELTQALSSLRMAIDLIHSHPGNLGSPKTAYQQGVIYFQTTLRLGQTLSRLGHVEEALNIFEGAYQQAPSFPELAESYAEILLDSGELRRAILPLETILNTEPEDISPYLNYARCLLELYPRLSDEINIEQAIPTLRRALEIQPDHPEAAILLAEALAASDDLLPAMDVYNKVMETELAQDPLWYIRLSLGMGQVALKLGQIETAVAAIQEAYQADPKNPLVSRSLSEAYIAAGLSEDAYQTAHQALSLAPADVESLIWFANQLETLKDKPGFNMPDADMEIINTLEQATQIEPQRTDLWVRLGQTLILNGKNDDALNAFRTITDIKNPTSPSISEDLYQAAMGLMKLEDTDGAVICLERALQPDNTPTSQKDPSLLKILSALSEAQYRNGDPQAALESLNQAILVAPDESSLYIDKANLLLEYGQAPTGSIGDESHLEQALSCLETALLLDPNDPRSHHQAALIKRSSGDLPAALKHAEHLIDLSSESLDQIIDSRVLAAELALVMLQPQLARSLLDYRETSNRSDDHGYHLDYHCMQAELAMDAGEDHVAVNQLVKILEIAPDDPRVLAIQARMSSSRHDHQAGLDTFKKAWETIDDTSIVSMSTLRSVAETAMETRQWVKAIQLWNTVVENASLEPLSHLSLARALVLRAEYQRLCQALDVVSEAPGQSSLSDEAHSAFEAAIQETEQQISKWVDNQREVDDINYKGQVPTMIINRWRARGKAVFEPSQENAQELAEMSHLTDGDVAALVACQREIGELNAAGLAAREYSQNPLVLLQLALALLEDKPKQAMAAVHVAAEAINQNEGQYQDGHMYTGLEIEPFILALQARLFHKDQTSVENNKKALKSIETALAIWPDEPRWHALAADIYLSDWSEDESSGIEAAIPHLEQATKLEPKYAPPYLKLGQIYLQERSIQKAIHTTAHATRLLPDNPLPWMQLAQAYLASGDKEKAGAYAERAVTLSPNQVEPLLLRGEIDLKSGNPGGAQSRAQAALRINPNSTRAISMMAKALSELGRTDEALSLLEVALQDSPNSLPLSLERVRIIRHAKGYDQALSAISELSERYPNEPCLLALQAEALEEAGESEKAIKAAQRALRGKDGPTPLALAEQAKMHYLLGCSFRRAGQLDQAVHHLSEAIRLSPDIVDAYLELGGTHEERREHNQAINVYRQAIAAVPNDHQAYYQIGLALKEGKDYLGAEKMLRQATELAPNEPGIHRMLAAVVALNLVHNNRELTHDMQVSA